MTLTAQRPSLGAGALLVAPGTRLPPGWQLEDKSVATGWSQVANTMDRLQGEKELVAAGWTLHFMAGAISAIALGSNRPKVLDSALTRLIAAVQLQKCNCLQIDDVAARSFWGIPYISIAAHMRHIQEGIIFSPPISDMDR